MSDEHRCWYNAPVQCNEISRDRCARCIYKPKNSPSGGLKLSDVIGMEEAKDILLRRLVDVVKHKKQLIERGARLGKGILLFGFPGTGKTMLAKAATAELMETNPNIAFEQITISDIGSSNVSSSDRKVRAMFTKWRKMDDKEWIILLDEADSVIPERSNVKSVLTIERVSAMLREIDGLQDTDNVYFVCTTNRPFMIDSAFMRAGRIEDRIFVDLPGESERIALLKHYLRGIDIDGKDNKISHIAANTENYSGADFSRMRAELILTEEIKKDPDPNYKLSDEDMTKAISRCRRPIGKNIEKMREEYLLFEEG